MLSLMRAVLVSWVVALAAGGQQVASIVLVNAATDADIGPLLDGAVVDLDATGTALNVRATTTGPVGSVAFEMSGAQAVTRTENVAPYALFGDTNGNYSAWNPPLGSYTLTITPWSGASASGTAGPAVELTFVVVRGGGEPPPPPPPPPPETGEDGDGSVVVSGELQRWHAVTLTLAGPWAAETGTPNPFLDRRMTVTFLHPASGTGYDVPGYFAADGAAGETGATAGNRWRAHLAPEHTGRWTWTVAFESGAGVAVSEAPGTPVAPFHGRTGEFIVAETDKAGRDFRAHGRLRQEGRYLRHLGSGEYFLKVGADSPENFLNDRSFDGTYADGGTDRTRLWEPHVADWRTGDPAWRGTLGRGIVGAVNYLAEQGMNVVSFLTYNVGGDSKDVWPFVAPQERLRYDCSKLDQWNVVFAHAQRRGVFLHFKTQETENDTGANALDSGEVGTERRLYYRELVARFGHHLALNWNLGEENTQTTTQRREMAAWFARNDPMRHPVVVHTYPNAKEAVYAPMLGTASELDGASLQSNWNAVHGDTLEWVRRSAAAGKPWVIANDEQGSANDGIPPDPGWPGYGGGGPSRTALRHQVLWGNLLAGGVGVESYFGYAHPESDLTCDDFRSRAGWWALMRHAHRFLTRYTPFWRMEPADALVGNASESGAGAYCLAAPGEVYAVYVPAGAAVPALNLAGVPAATTFQVRWYDPRNGGDLQSGSVTSVSGGASVSLGAPPAAPGEDWVALVFVPRTVLFIRGGPGTGGFLEGGSDEQLADITNGQTFGGNHGWKEWADALRADGFEPVQLIEDGAPVDLASLDLARHAVIVLGSNNAAYDAADVDAVEAYVRSGGGLLVISDANFGSTWSDASDSDQPFLDRFGLLVHQDTGTYGLQRSLGDFLVPDHPVFEGVNQFDGEGVSPARRVAPVDGARVVLLARAKGNVRLNTVSGGAGPTVPATADDAALAVVEAGRGRVAVTFDRNTFFNLNGAGTSIRRFDNRTYALNLVHWLAGHRLAAGETYASWAAGVAWGEVARLPGVDGDGDGLDNGGEFVFDGDPLTPGRSPILRVETVAGAVVVDVRLRGGRTGVLEWSDDLVRWTALRPHSGGVVRTVVDADPDGDGTAVHWRWEVPVSLVGALTFLRVRGAVYD